MELTSHVLLLHFSTGKNSGSDEIRRAVAAIPHESGSKHLPFFTLVKVLCGQLLRVMNKCAEGDRSEDTVIIRAGLKLWEALMHFSYEDGICIDYL